MDTTQQQLFAITAGAGREFPVRFGNDLWKMRCTPAHAHWTPEISLPLRIAGEEAVLELAFTPGGNLFLRHAEFTEVASMSEPFALAIRSTLNRELLDSLQTVLDAGIEIASSPITDAPPLAMAFEVLDTSGVREASGALRIGRQVFARIEALQYALGQATAEIETLKNTAADLKIKTLECEVLESELTNAENQNADMHAAIVRACDIMLVSPMGAMQILEAVL